MKEKLASFLVPLLTAVVLLYQVLTDLQIAVMHKTTLLVIGVTLAVAAVLGLVAAISPAVVRVGILALCTVLFIDVTFDLPKVFDRMHPDSRGRVSTDQTRVADLHRIKAALDEYVAKIGPLPAPSDYGEGTGTPDFWLNYWDVSSHDGDGDGVQFLDFLVDTGILPTVPVDPVNAASADSDPRGGKHYVFFLVPPEYVYAGGVCDPKKWVYMLAITDLEYDPGRPPITVKGSGCDCLWKDKPNFFQEHFDYVLCGTYEATPASIAFAAKRRAAATDAALREKARRESETLAVHRPQDRKRVDDLFRIRTAMETYIQRFGPPPAPLQYGEAEKSTSANFWQYYWDVSSEDGDGDGRPFLDFLAESGVMPNVPVDPDNVRAPDGDPRGGRQFVYYLAPPDNTYEGGSCVSQAKKWVYMLGITDLRSEITRPPMNISGSGCECLWRNKPDFFQQHFDYVVCGAFDVTPESLARAAAAREKFVAGAPREKARRDTTALAHIPQDQRRVADILKIRQGLQAYIEKVGPLPAPLHYGEAERSDNQTFLQHYWDVSSEDGDGDGKPFLDFLVESGVMPSVPVDPENVRAPDGDPRGGRQYAYFLAPPDMQYAGGSCARDTNRWVYMLGITDLRSEITRPPSDIRGSGCDCLWKDKPNFFQQHFDYVVCGTFRK